MSWWVYTRLSPSFEARDASQITNQVQYLGTAVWSFSKGQLKLPRFDSAAVRAGRLKFHTVGACVCVCANQLLLFVLQRQFAYYPAGPVNGTECKEAAHCVSVCELTFAALPLLPNASPHTDWMPFCATRLYGSE